MSTHPVFAGEHAPSSTLFRGQIAGPTTIQVLRKGHEVARYAAHLNSPVSVSREGLLCPEVPDCRECGRLMFFVGSIAAGQARDDLADAGVFAFHCEDCGVAAQVVQLT